MIAIPKAFYRRPRMLIAFILGLIIALLLPVEWRLITRMLTGWNMAVWSYLMLMASLIARTDHVQVQNIAEQEDKGAVAVLMIMSVAAILSLAAIGFELSAVNQLAASQRFPHYLLTITTVVGSWMLIGVVFTLHYAHTFYQVDKKFRPFMFPDKKDNPDYWDFLYFSFTISTAAQTSDISVMTTAARKTVTAHTLLSFLFNAAIIGLLINIAAGIMSSQ